MQPGALADLVGWQCDCEFSTDVGIYLAGHPHEATVMAVEGPMIYLAIHFSPGRFTGSTCRPSGGFGPCSRRPSPLPPQQRKR